MEKNNIFFEPWLSANKKLAEKYLPNNAKYMKDLHQIDSTVFEPYKTNLEIKIAKNKVFKNNIENIKGIFLGFEMKKYGKNNIPYASSILLDVPKKKGLFKNLEEYEPLRIKIIPEITNGYILSGFLKNVVCLNVVPSKHNYRTYPLG